MKPRKIAMLTFVSMACACARTTPTATLAPMQHMRLAWSEVPGWSEEDHAAAFAAFAASCRAVVSHGDARLQPVCRSALAQGGLDGAAARAFFEASFSPERISAPDETDGLLTGYYVPVFAGSRVPTAKLSAPFYAKPSNPDLAYSRADIEGGALVGKGLELLWADPVDVFFAQVQGSARVRLDDGSLQKLEYAAKNTHPYTSIGRVLIDRGLVSKDAMSMQRIKQWMDENPEAAVELRQQNASYVFFSAAPSSGDEEGRGAQGLPLMPGRSVAVDHGFHPYGTPIFISASLPIADATATTPFQHLMIAMDTGTAIVGPARADIYWGVGEAAATVAGRIKHRGSFTLLLPR